MPLTEANHNERISLTREQLQTINRLVTHSQIFDISDAETIGHIAVVFRLPDENNAGRWSTRVTNHIAPSGAVVAERIETL